MTTKKNYNWKRYWCKPNGRIDINTEGGFLLDPENHYSSYVQDIKSFEEIAHIPCLALLGEPGIGKTEELKKAFESTKENLALTNDDFIYIKLGEYSDEKVFLEDSFRNENLSKAKREGRIFYLFLDSLDECKIQIDNIAGIIAREIERMHWDGLKIRITCRTAEWHSTLEERLKSLYQNDCEVYELQPLTRKDAKTTFEENGLDADKLFDEIYKKEIGALASRPVTLNFITRVFDEKGELPKTRKEIFEQGLYYLVSDEHNTLRTESNKIIYASDQKLIAAKRIAFLMLLSNKSTLALTRTTQTESNNSIFINELIGAENNFDPPVEVDRKLILATIDTGLFVLNGSDKYSWAHQTFAEYLCASYVYEKGLQDEQILNLFFQFDGDKQIAIPQLEESIGWLLSIKPDLIAKVFNENLTLMFKCDILFQQNDLKRTLFFSLLNGVNSSEIFYPRHRLIKQYHKLSFPDISKLIIEFVEDSTKSIQTKIEAICIGNQCGLVELKDFYCNQLNTFSMPAILRTVILDAHYLHNDRDFIEAVKNTLYNYLSDDDNDQLKGDCLSLLYPQHLNFGEIIHLLRPRKNTRYIGSYVVFLGGINLGKADLNMGEILIGLKWVQKLGAKNIVSNYHLDDIVDGIMIEALEFLDDESILNSYADAVVALVNNHSNIVEQKNKDRFIKKLSETNSRKRLIELLINKMINPQVNIWSLTSHRTRLVNKSDFLWLLEKGTNECRLEYKEAFYNLCHRLFDEENSEQREIMLALAEEDELLKVVFKSLLQPIELNGKDANDAKKIYKESHSFSYYGKSRLSYLSHKERLLYHIDLLKSDSKSAVWRLIYFISYDHVNDELFGELNPILENHPGWKNLNHEEIDLLLRKGKTYLLEQESNSKKWFGKNQYNRVDYAAYKLLLYFHRFENDYFNQLQINVLKKWIPVLITFPLQGSDDNAIDSQKKLIVEIHQKIPKIFEELFEKILDSELDRNESLTCLKFYEQCWNDKYSELLLKKLSITLKPSSFNSIIGFLGKQAPNYLIKYFSELTKKNIPSESDQLENFISGISLNAKIKSEEVIEYLGHNKNINRELTRKILIRIAQRDDYNSDFFNNASIQVFVELYLIIAELFTKEELERTENDFASYVSPYDKLNDFKTNLLMTIRERKTAESIGALELLVKNYPAESMFKEILYDTKVLVRYNAWKPNDIPELKEFLKNDKKRLVSNEDELLSEIIASLKRLEAKMHGTPPQVRQLWSEKKINIPKDESTLSDMLQFHLKEDLKSIVVNAEVVIDRFNRTKKGKQVDLIVDATSDKYEQISVIVEVKGSWNPKLHESMKTQLKERYLKERPYRFGLYLVGWYLCDEWQRFKENDNRFRQNKKKTIEVVIEEMERQAQSLSDKNCAIKSFVLDCRYNR